MLETATPTVTDDTPYETNRKERFRAAAEVVQWSAPALALRLGYNSTIIWRWLSTTHSAQPPEPVVCWIEEIASFIAAHPPPSRD